MLKKGRATNYWGYVPIKTTYHSRFHQRMYKTTTRTSENSKDHLRSPLTRYLERLYSTPNLNYSLRHAIKNLKASILSKPPL